MTIDIIGFFGSLVNRDNITLMTTLSFGEIIHAAIGYFILATPFVLIFWIYQKIKSKNGSVVNNYITNNYFYGDEGKRNDKDC